MSTPISPLTDHLADARATDYFFIREQLSDAQLHALRRVRALVDDEVLPVIAGYWERAEMPWSVIRRIGELGIVGEDIEGYGCPGLDPIACGLVHMELNRGDGSLGTFLGVHAGLAMKSIAMLGSEEQKQDWLPRMARLEKLALDRKRQPGRRRRRLGARRGRQGQRVPRGNEPDPPARVQRRGDRGQGLAARDLAGADRARRRPRPGRESPPGRHLLQRHRPRARHHPRHLRWAALGHAVAAYDTALTYAMRREQFGKPLVSFQIVPDRLVKMLAEVTSMQLYCLQIGRLAQCGQLTDTIAGLAKLNNTRKARQICAEARDVLGGNGILLENHVIRHMADIEAIHTYEGTETM